MAITIDYGNTNIIDVAQADLNLVSGTLYELDTEVFRLALKDLEDDATGIAFSQTHSRAEPVTVAGVTYAQAIIILPPYRVRFEDGQYTVRLVNSNNNIFDVENGILFQNQVQVIPTNAAGLIISTIDTGGSSLTAAEQVTLANILKVLKNKLVTDPITGIMTVFDDDDVSVLFQGDLFEDAAALQAYRGKGAERRERLALRGAFGAEFSGEFA